MMQSTFTEVQDMFLFIVVLLLPVTVIGFIVLAGFVSERRKPGAITRLEHMHNFVQQNKNGKYFIRGLFASYVAINWWGRKLARRYVIRKV